MQYRKFGKLDWKVSALGFGAMRLPVLGLDPKKPADMMAMQQAKVDESEAIRMIRYAIDHGVNYLDSAYLYHNGESEKIIAKALQDGYRGKVRLATKLPAIIIESEKDFDRIFNEQAQRLQTDKIDFYLLHSMTRSNWSKVRDLGVIPWLEGLLARGKIGYAGFSFHDNFDVFKEIIDYYDNWTFCQVQYNYMDVNEQAGRRGVEYAAGKNLGIVIMEPLRGGLLTKTPPKKVAEIWRTASKERSLAEWGLQWIWNQPEISVVLSGMSTMEQVVENVSIADRSKPGILTDEEEKLIGRVREAYKGLRPVPCTSCGYCLPCPNEVSIPQVFEIYNEAAMYEDPNIGKFRYNTPFGINQNQRGDKCVECGECLEKCPQHIPIPEWLKKAHADMYREMPAGPGPFGRKDKESE